MYQQKCPIYRNSKAVRDMVLFLMRALACEKAASRNMHPDVLAQVEWMMWGTSEIWQRQKQCGEGRFQALDYILAMPKRRRLPGWWYYSTMGRSIRMTRMPMFQNICVILTRGAQSEIVRIFVGD